MRQHTMTFRVKKTNLFFKTDMGRSSTPGKKGEREFGRTHSVFPQERSDLPASLGVGIKT